MGQKQKISVFEAGPQDDAELRRILREIPMRGHVRIRFTREPSYFEAAQVEGETVEVAAAGENPGGRIVGFGARAEKQCFVNGIPQYVGYMSGLRLEKPYRRGLLVAKGYKLIHKFSRRGKAGLSLTTIIESNKKALKLLPSGKGGLPQYRDIGRIVTLTIRARRARNKNAIAVRPALEDDLSGIIEFWKSEGPRRQFFPCYQKEHLTGGEGLLRGLSLGDILIARNDGGIIGTLALWDQTTYKQSWVDGYSGILRSFRPLYNAIAAVTNRPALPAPGKQIHYRTAALICIRNDAKYVLDALLRTALNRANNERNLHSIAIAFHESDPLLPVARQWPHYTYNSRLFVVNWPEADSDFQQLDDRVPYLELGAL